MTHESMADEVVAQFDGMLDLVGVAVGGSIIQHILTRHPERVRSAVIACSSAPILGGAVEARRKQAEERIRPALERGMEAVVDVTLRRWFTPFAVRTEPPGVAYAKQRLLSMDPNAWSDIWLAGPSSAIIPHERLKEIEQPVTIVSAMHDASVGIAGGFTLHSLIPNSRLEIVPGPHMLHLERPDTLFGALVRHLKWAPIGHRVEAPQGSCGE
jgi:pimeloyl-ACP methyl ester carboxylesterase